MPKKESKKNGDEFISHTILSENANHNVSECKDHEQQFKMIVCFKCKAIKVKCIFRLTPKINLFLFRHLDLSKPVKKLKMKMNVIKF